MRQRTKGNDLIKYGVIGTDFLLLNLLLYAFVKLEPTITPSLFHYEKYYALLATNLSMMVAQYWFHNIVFFRHVSIGNMVIRVLKLTLTQGALMFVSLRLLGNVGGLFNFMVMFCLAEFVVLFLSRLLENTAVQQLRKLGRNTRFVAFVGSDPANLMLYSDLMTDAATGYDVLGYYSDTPFDDAPEELHHLGNISDLFAEMASPNTRLAGLDDLFCSLSHSQSDTIIRVMRFCDEHIIHFRYVPRMFGNFRLNLKPERYGDMTLFTNHEEPLSNPVNRVLKRAFDIAFSAIVCLCLLPLIPIFALIIKRQSPGPIFFTQDRTGMNGDTFRCYKFRSMHVNNDADTLQATKDDPRKFSFGAFMRKTNIDELPQFFNVLKGDMSVVGPRPHMVHHTEIYGKLIDKYMVRHFCKPGITGWAQVTGYRGETKEQWQMEGRIKRDIWYIENWTFLLDIEIIFKTVWSVIVPDKKAY